MLTLLRKPKPKWDDLKEKLRKRHRDRSIDGSESHDTESEQQDEEYADAEEGGETGDNTKVCLAIRPYCDESLCQRCIRGTQTKENGVWHFQQSLEA